MMTTHTDHDTQTPVGERIHKKFAELGLASRRESERWIAAGRVKVNGLVAQPGQKIIPGDRVTVDGQSVALLRAPIERRVLLYNKPEGEICSVKDPEGRPTVFSHLPKLKHGRWIAVGRLDINTSGALLLTTDGELANRLMHPKYTIEREYAVRVCGKVSQAQMDALHQGVMLEDGEARFTDIVASGGRGVNQWFHVVLMEGRNREVRRLWESQGVSVSRLKRVRYGCVFVPSTVRAGQWQELPIEDVNELAKLVDLPPLRKTRRSAKAQAQDARHQRKLARPRGRVNTHKKS